MAKVININIDSITIECKLNSSNIPLQKITFKLEKKIFEPEIKDYIIVCNRDSKPPNNYVTTVFKSGKMIISNIRDFNDIEATKKKVLLRMSQMGCDYNIISTRVRESVVKYELENPVEDESKISDSFGICNYNKKMDVTICSLLKGGPKNSYCIIKKNKKDIIMIGLESQRQIEEVKDIIERNIAVQDNEF